MRHRSIQALYDYWNTVRGNRPAPARTEIDPRGVATALGDIFLLDGPAADFRFRLAGSRVVAAVGQTLTGRRFDEIWLETAREAARHALASPADEGEPILVGIRAFEPPDPYDSPRLTDTKAASRLRWPNLRLPGSLPRIERRGVLVGAGEMILLPLTHQNRVGSRILGALALFDPPAMPATRPQGMDISGTRVLGRAARPQAGTGLLPSDIADSVISRHGHLVVIRGSNSAGNRSPQEN
jgi:hypothetical protein